MSSFHSIPKLCYPARFGLARRMLFGLVAPLARFEILRSMRLRGGSQGSDAAAKTERTISAEP